MLQFISKAYSRDVAVAVAERLGAVPHFPERTTEQHR